MARFKHVQSGAVVNVSDATAARLGSEWQSHEDEATTEEKSDEKPRRRRSSSRKSDQS